MKKFLLVIISISYYVVLASTRPYLLFGTTSTSSGDFSLGSNLDVLCQAEAISKGYLGGNVYLYGYNVSTRLQRTAAAVYGPTGGSGGSHPYGTLLANTLTSFRTSALLTTLELAGVCPTGKSAWTGLNNGGSQGSAHCTGFTSTLTTGAAALCSTSVTGWETSAGGSQPCSNLNHLLCMWDPPITSTPSLTPTTSKPTTSPTKSPTKSPTSSNPTHSPSNSPSTSKPTVSPSRTPSTSIPTLSPTKSPTFSHPTNSPSKTPSTSSPSRSPTRSPSQSKPTVSPSKSPSTSKPSTSPTKSPSTSKPTKSPTVSKPTKSPSTSKPTGSPFIGQTHEPSVSPAIQTLQPSISPSKTPTNTPTLIPTSIPTSSPSSNSSNPVNNVSADITIAISLGIVGGLLFCFLLVLLLLFCRRKQEKNMKEENKELPTSATMNGEPDRTRFSVQNPMYRFLSVRSNSTPRLLSFRNILTPTKSQPDVRQEGVTGENIGEESAYAKDAQAFFPPTPSKKDVRSSSSAKELKSSNSIKEMPGNPRMSPKHSHSPKTVVRPLSEDQHSLRDINRRTMSEDVLNN